MKKLALVSLLLTGALTSMTAQARQPNVEGFTCETKQQAVETQITYAKAHNQTDRIKGLEKALDDIKSYCSNDDLEEKYQEKIEEKTEKVAERQEDLAKARLKGDSDKIAKQENKLNEAEAELNEAKADLDAFYKALAK